MKTIELKRAGLEDLDLLIPLFEAYREFYQQSPNPVAARHFLRDRILADESVIFTAQTGDVKTIGFVQLYPIFSSTRMKRLWLLNDLFVDKGFRQMGIAERLIQKAQEYALATKSAGLILETGRDNLPGNSLYIKCGFHKDQEHNYYHWST